MGERRPRDAPLCGRADDAGDRHGEAVVSAAPLAAQHLRLSKGYSPLAAGLRLLPWTATPVLMAPAASAQAGRLSERRGAGHRAGHAGRRLVCVAGIATEASGYARFVAPVIIVGIGISMTLCAQRPQRWARCQRRTSAGPLRCLPPTAT